MSDYDEQDSMVGDNQLSHCDDHGKLPRLYYSGNEMGEMDLDTNDYDLTIDDEDRDQLPIGCLHFTNGLSQELIAINIFEGREIHVGREENSSVRQFIVADFRVSRKHFRIYSVIYEHSEDDSSEIQPLIYCEDLESANGTYVNNKCIGKFGDGRTGGFLLTHGDTIEIRPHWKYQFQQFRECSEGIIDGASEDLQYFQDRFHVTSRLLGTGHYGKVYLSKELSTCQQVACKIVDLKKVEDESMNSVGTWAERCRKAKDERDKLFREITVLAHLTHPHIIDLKKAFCSNNFIYILTELAPSGDLFSYCNARGGTLSDVESRIICRQIALALDYMHQKNIAHRDIKKENVLVMQTYDFSCRVVLTDFGFATYVNQKTGRMMSRVGTPGYVAPEVDTIDQASDGYTTIADLYSLGALAVNMLASDALLPRDTYSQQSEDIVKTFIGGAKIKGLSIRGDDCLRRLLSPEPKARLSARQVLQHAWFKKPQGEASAIEDACSRINKNWTARGGSDGVMEDLPDKIALRAEQSTNHSTKAQRRVLDMNPNPFIGLASYLNPRSQSTRGLILQSLKEKGALFVTNVEDPPVPQNSNAHKHIPRSNPGLGTNMLGRGLSKPRNNSNRGSFEAELSSVSTGIPEYQIQLGTEGSKGGSGMNWSDTQRPIKGQDIRPRLSLASFQESFSKQIPRDSNTKTYGDEVRNMLQRDD